MSKRDKQKRKKGKKTTKGPTTGIDVHKARLLMEKEMAAIQKLVDEREFESEDEMNKFIQSLVSFGEIGRLAPRSPLEGAQELMYQAWETPITKERVKLAHQALEISPDCADAYVLLAEETAKNIVEALKLYQLGVEAGERALGAKAFDDYVGHFWGILETRPYMRARVGLAQCLWGLGKHEEAIGHYRDMLRLNPGDNQGIRYLLAACLLEKGEVDDLQELLGKYDEPTAAWLYTGALVTFLRQGDSLESRRCLREAIECNRHVIPYLLGEKNLPKQLPQYMSFGDKSEAIIYAAEFGLGWFKAKDAVSWLESVCRNEQIRRPAKPKPLDVPDVFLQAFEPQDKTQQPMEATSVEVYVFKVSLKESPEVWRKIEVKGSQTLHRLHEAIFQAYERYDEHLYAFFLSNKPWDSSSEYGIPDPESSAKNAKRARIDSLGLQVRKRFLYLFDFGDEWWHSIELLGIKEEEPRGRYPRIVGSQGEAPPQYPPYEEDD